MKITKEIGICSDLVNESSFGYFEIDSKFNKLGYRVKGPSRATHSVDNKGEVTKEDTNLWLWKDRVRYNEK